MSKEGTINLGDLGHGETRAVALGLALIVDRAEDIPDRQGDKTAALAVLERLGDAATKLGWRLFFG